MDIRNHTSCKILFFLGGEMKIFENFLKKFFFVIYYFLFFFFMDVLYRRRRRDHTVKPFWNFYLFFVCF